MLSKNRKNINWFVGHRLIWSRIGNTYSIFDWFPAWQAGCQIKYPFFPEKHNKPAEKLLGRGSAYNRSICFGNSLSKIYWAYIVRAPFMLISGLSKVLPMLLCWDTIPVYYGLMFSGYTLFSHSNIAFFYKMLF